MKVVVINGSPNEKGCTYTALNEMCVVLNSEGIGTEMIHIGKNSIKGCIGCQACSNNGHRCVFEGSEVNRVLDAMEEADGLVIGSPVFFASPNGALISLMDRIFMAGNKFSMKPAAAVASARRAGTTATLDVIYKYFSLAGMPIVTSNYYNVIHGHTPEETKQDLEGLQTMRVLGRNMAWMLKSFEMGRKMGILKPEAEKKIKTSYIR